MGLFALAWLSLGSPVAAADLASPATGGDPGSATNAIPVAPGEAPAFAGRVDPDTYRAGPGDEFAFRSSDLLDPRILRVGPTGDLLLPDAGSVPVAGLTLREVEARAREILRPYVRGKGFVLTLHRPRRFRAMVVGDVERPGDVLVQAPVRASDVILAAGGVTAAGARRGIALRRGSDTLWVDLERFERTGDLAANPLMFETDILVVPPSLRRVEVSGFVAHPGSYDLAPGDRASVLIAVAGGLTDAASPDRIVLSRESTPGRREEIAVGGAEDDPLLEPGDRLLVSGLSHWREGSRVDVLGEVSRPGPYGIVDGSDRLGDVLQRAGGFTTWADSMSVRVERGAQAAVRDTAFLRLAREQEALVPAGDRGYVATTTRANEIVSLSASRWAEGGHAWTSWMELPLLAGDRVVVPRRPLTVMVQGEVMSPGHVPYRAGWNVSDFVNAAGGYTGRANRGRALVTLAATGRPVSASDVKTIGPGDAIWVPVRDPRNTWTVITDVLTTTAQLATIVLVVREVTK